jgi:N-acetylmuramoyl-L-alanine amidase
VGTLLLVLLAIGARAEPLSVITAAGVVVGELEQQFVDGTAYVGVEALRAVLDGVASPMTVRYRYTPALGKITVQLRAGGESATARCRIGAREVTITGADPVILAHPPIVRDGGAWLPLEFLSLVSPLAVGLPVEVGPGGVRLTLGALADGAETVARIPEPVEVAPDEEVPYTSTPARRSAWSGLRVMVDPGHGGADAGVVLHGLTESALALELARELVRVGRSVGGRVALTRDRDVSMTIAQRLDRAEKRGSTVYVSLHFNSAASPVRSGYRVVVDDSAPGGLASALHRALGSAGFVGVETVLPLLTTRGATMPAAHIEMGFLSNVDEARLWLNPTTRRLAAEAIWAGLAGYRP